MSLTSPLLTSIFRLNHLSLWQREVEVWGNRVTATSADRLLNLYLHHIGWRGGEERRLLERYVKPAMKVFDIGANQGIYTMFLSRLVGADGHIHAFEPDADLFASLRRNCESNRLANVSLHNIALGCAAGSMRLYRSQLNSGDNRLARSQHPFWFNEVEVQVTPLDTLMPEESVDFIKIDVQGWEHQVFLGMRGILQRNPHVRIYLEYWPLGLRNAGCQPQDCLRHLISLGFKLYLPSVDGLNPVQDVDHLTQQCSGGKYTNLLALR